MQIRRGFIDAAAGRTCCHQYLQPSTPKGTTIPTKASAASFNLWPCTPSAAKNASRAGQGSRQAACKGAIAAATRGESCLWVVAHYNES